MNTEPRPAPASPPAAHTVLLVDDEPQALKWFARQYGDEFEVLTAAGAAQALDLLATHGPAVAVLLTDYRMPSHDGVALLAEVRSRHPMVSRLLMSAYADKQVAMDAVNQGQVEQILEKPLDEALTRQALRAAREACQRRWRDHMLLQRRDDTVRETLGFLAHELGTPLATVSGYLHAMQDRQQEPACGQPELACLGERRPGEFATMLDAALRRADYAQSLVSTFVHTARDAYRADGSGTQRASDLVRSVCEGYPFDEGEAGWVHCAVAQDFVLPGQRDLVYLVLCTLVKNALLALRAAPPAQPRIRIEVQAGAESDIIRVCDNGPGVPAPVLARLTREPVTTREGRGGSGMGLILSQRVMDSLGGRVEVRSAPGDGTAVSLYFQRCADANVQEVFP